jgi:membrane associated rhomboid family serine protease
MGFFPIGDDNSMRTKTPYVVYGVFAANALMWMLQLSRGEAFTSGYSTVPYEITHGVDLAGMQRVVIEGRVFEIGQYPGPAPIYLTLLTSMFMHGSWMHIIGNMLYLVIFADQIEDLLGHGRFLLFYLLCGLAAGVAQILWQPASIIPCLGASGAIAGCLGAYLVRYPTNGVRVLLFRDVVVLPAFLVLGGWILLQIFSQIGSSAGKASGVAYLAHIGGFAAGVALVFLLAIGRSSKQPERERWNPYGDR